MKKSMLPTVKTLLLSLFLATAVCHAQPPESSNPGGEEKSFDLMMYMGAGGKVNLHVATYWSKRVTITLLNAENAVILRKNLKRSPICYRLKFSFEESISGVYRFEISDGHQTVVRQVEVVDFPPVASQRYIVYNPQSSR
jgi:hypothetical protein